jgi:hypothetical protein
MSPKTDDLYDLLQLVDLINQPMLDVDASGEGPG